MSESKQVQLWKFPLLIEVIAFAQPLVRKKVEAWGASASLRHSNGRPFVTGEGHPVLDCSFGLIARSVITRSQAQ